MTTVDVTWRECPRQQIKLNPAYLPAEPYDSGIECEFPFMLTGEEAAASILQAQIEAEPESWTAFDYIIEILAPDSLAGRYAVSVVMEIACEATELEEAA
ncbi:hypothetical protein [Methylorubrum extorquens]|uniref:hypothetical protein n=1 Tax=Methylorubrum extorquens TaxID=408 RepID=UPI0020A09150|nr:hypothetical protein [Methylorubrum extorquens]MCP1540034.1 hypothetical protein [Methylorubrum extorquens]